MNDKKAFMAGSFVHSGSAASFRNEVEITPEAFCRPAGLNAFAIDAEALSRRMTGCQSSSAIFRNALAAKGGATSSNRMSAPEFLRTSICVSSEEDSERSKVVSATIIRDQS